MKKIWMLLAMAAIFAGCSNEEEFESQAGYYTLTGYADAESRTAFGIPDDGSIPFKWSKGDKIRVGSTQSDAIANDGNSAIFTFASEPSGDVYYNMTGDFATEAWVKTEQSVGNLGTNGDFGYGIISNGSFKLNHATAYLWFDVTSSISKAKLETIKIHAEGGLIAGKATWNGSSFGPVSDGKSFVELTVGKQLASTNNNVWAMVVLPTDLSGKTVKVTYKLTIDNATKYYTQTLQGKKLTAGTTQKITADINSDDLTDYELRVLTFEDADAKFESYYLNYVNNYEGKEIKKWSDLIDSPQYMGPLTYGNNQADAEYSWYDEGNTELAHTFPDNYAYCFWGGGHAISNYWGTGWEDEDRNKHIAEYYGQDYVDQWAGQPGADSFLGWFNVQMMAPVAPHSGDNFVVHYGYKDSGNYIENLPEISFADDKARVIDHMYVVNTNYTLNQLYNGVKSEEGNTFGGSWEGLNDDAWLKIVAQGFDDVDADAYAEPISEVEFYLVQGENVVTDWQKWDLSGLGAVKKVRFNFLYSNEMGGQYGFTIPGYFAYDDIAVRFEE